MRRLFEQSRETAAILAYMRAMPIDKPVSFAEVERVVGPFKRSAYRSAVDAARREGVVTAGVRGFGFVRLNPTEIVERQATHFRSIRRKARMVQTEVSAALRGNLAHRDQMRATTIHAAAGVVLATAVVPVSNESKAADPRAYSPRDLRPKPL